MDIKIAGALYILIRGSLALDFSAAGLQDLTDESWGLSSINVGVDAQQRYKYHWPLFI